MRQKGRWLRFILVIAYLLTLGWPTQIWASSPPPVPGPGKMSPPASPEFEPGQLLVQFKPTADQPDLQQALAKPALQGLISKVKLEVAQTGLYQLYLVPGANLEAVIKTLQAEPGVVLAEPNYIYHLFDLSPPNLVRNSSLRKASVRNDKTNALLEMKDAPHRTTNDPFRASQYYLDITSVPAAWNLTTGDRFTVAVEDSGVRFDHPDLIGRVRSDGFNFVTDTNDVHDDLGHGTEVAGLIAANSNNGIGIAGISWAAQILPVKIANAQGSIDANAAAEGIYYAVAHGARILNLSYGGETSSGVLQEAVAYALSQQVTVVAAGGNAPDGAPEYPAAYQGVIAVTATDAGDQLAFFDSYGSYIALSAPGQDIYTTGLNKNNSGDYGLHSGTSFSSPIVAGTAALMLSLNPYLRPGQILQALKQTADKVYPKDPAYYYYYGAGRLNAVRAVQLAAQLPQIPFPPAHAANVLFSQHLQPDQTVKPGDYLTLDVAATNLGPDKTTSTWLNVPLNSNLSLQYVLTQPGAANEWVTGVFSDHFNIQLGALQPSSVVTFTAVFRVNPSTLPGTNITFPLTGFWDADDVGSSNNANSVAVQVGSSSSNKVTNYKLTAISPQNGKIGQAFQMTGEGFAANEPLALWLNLPDGTVQPVVTTKADSTGAISYLFSSTNQKQSGNYSLVAHGQFSQIELVGYFSLTQI